MKLHIPKYLKRNNFTDVDKVNTLLVTAFAKGNSLDLKNHRLLSNYYMPDNDSIMEFAQQFVKNGNIFTLEDLARLFEYVISPVDRIVTGAVYTPLYVRKAILQKTLDDKNAEELRRLRIADISCGCGCFLMDVALYLHRKTGKPYKDIFKNNIYGIDIQRYAIERTKIILSLLALSEGEDVDFDFNLLCRDSLDYICDDWNEQYTEFDVIVGNPPYVCSRNLSEDSYAKLKNYDVCVTGHPDLYIPFFKIAIDMLKTDGRLGYITMNTFLKSVNGRAIRNFFAQNRFSISIIDFRGHQIFDSKNTYTCLFYLDKQNKAEYINYTVDERGALHDNNNYTAVPYAGLDNDKGWALNDYNETLAIESVGIQIKDYCSSRHGIATLRNDIYIFKPIDEDKNYYYHECNNIRYPIEKDICRDIVNPNKLNSVDNLNLLIEKVIFPYRIVNGQALIFDPEEMIRQFPRTLAYLTAHRELLLGRDKGNTRDYPQWYAYGRTQSLILPRFKLFFPKYANKSLRCIICDAPDLMLYNGLAFVNEDERRLLILKSIIESNIFWNYIQTNGKPYASGYYSLSGVDIKHFGIPKFSVDEENELLAIDDRAEIERWLRKRYNVN